MKKVITSALVALALVGSAVGASAAVSYPGTHSELYVPFPGPHASLDQTLNFWQQFADRDRN